MGDLGIADQTLQEAEALVQQEHTALFTSWVIATRVHYWLVTGNMTQASQWATRVEFQQETWNPTQKGMFLMQVRVYLAQHRYQQAIEALERFSTQFDESGDREYVINFLILSIIALSQGGKSIQARSVAVRLLAMTEPGGYIRIYLDAGEPMQQVLEGLFDETRGTPVFFRSYLTTLLTAFAQVREHRNKVPLANSISTQPMPLSQPVSATTPLFLEPLSRREQEVLCWLAQGASNQEIAKALVIQLSTVKKHVSNLLAKLGAENRTQAIALARQYSLL
jgi:LuxR family maltose regulon positive regulatory protein